MAKKKIHKSKKNKQQKGRRSLFRSGGSPFWYTRIKYADGHVGQWSTRCQEEGDAILAAIKKQAEEDRRNPETEGATCRQLVEAFHGTMHEVTDSTLRQYGNAAQHLFKGLGPLADQPPTQLTEDAIMAVKGHIYANLSGNTIQDRGWHIKRLLKHLLQRGGHPETWLDEFKFSGRATTESPRDVFSQEEIQRLRIAANGDTEIIAFINMAENIGARISDQCRLMTHDYSFEKGRLSFLNRKTNLRCRVWLMPHNVDYIRQKLKEANDGNVPLFPTYYPTGDQAAKAITMFRNLLLRSGIRTDADRVVRKDPGAVIDTYCHTFHSFRNTLVTRLASQGVALHVIMSIVGHKNMRTTRRYIAVYEADKDAAIQRLFGVQTPQQVEGVWSEMARQMWGQTLYTDTCPMPEDPQVVENPPVAMPAGMENLVAQFVRFLMNNPNNAQTALKQIGTGSNTAMLESGLPWPGKK